MSDFDYGYSTITKYRSGDSDDPYIPVTQTEKIINQKIILSEIPVIENGVQIPGLHEYKEIPLSGMENNGFYVDYNEGIVHFANAQEGNTVVATYYGRGNHYVSARRIWTRESSGEVIQTLEELVEDIQDIVDEANKPAYIDVTSARWGADPTGATDSGAKINAAIQFGRDNGIYHVYAPPGTYLMEEPLKILSNIHFIGSGVGTVFLTKPGVDMNCMYTPTTVQNAYMGYFLLDGNIGNVPGNQHGHGVHISINHCVLDHIFVRNVPKMGMRFSADDTFWSNDGQEVGCFLNVIRHCHVQNAVDWGIEVGWRMTDSWFLYNNIGSTGANVRLQGGGPFRFIGNHFNGDNPGPENNVLITEGGNNLLFQNNIMEGARHHAFYFRYPGWDAGVEHVSISNNIIRSCSRSSNGAFSLVKIEGRPSYNHRSIIVTGNQMNNFESGTAPKYCVEADNVNGLIIANNDFASGFSRTRPIGLKTSCSDVQIGLNIGGNQYDEIV